MVLSNKMWTHHQKTQLFRSTPYLKLKNKKLLKFLRLKKSKMMLHPMYLLKFRYQLSLKVFLFIEPHIEISFVTHHKYLNNSNNKKKKFLNSKKVKNLTLKTKSKSKMRIVWKNKTQKRKRIMMKKKMRWEVCSNQDLLKVSINSKLYKLVVLVILKILNIQLISQMLLMKQKLVLCSKQSKSLIKRKMTFLRPNQKFQKMAWVKKEVRIYMKIIKQSVNCKSLPNRHWVSWSLIMWVKNLVMNTKKN